MITIVTERDIKRVANKIGTKNNRLIKELEKEYEVNLLKEDEEELNVDDVDQVNDIVRRINDERGLDELTVRDLFFSICEENPEKRALVFDGEKRTYAELRKNVENLLSGLVERGMKKGDRVAILLPNTIEYIEIYFALFCIGAWPVPLNTRWEKEEIYNILDDSGTKYIFCQGKIGALPYGEYIEEYQEKKGTLKEIIYFGEDLYDGRGMPYEEIMRTGSGKQKFVNIEPQEVAMISYTSGTTGSPKGVLLKNNDIVKISCYATAIWKEGDAVEFPLSIAPLYSAQGFLSLFINFALKQTFKMISSFNPNDILREISKGENTVVHTQPTMWSLLLNCRIIEFVNFKGLTKLVVSGSLCSPELARRIEGKIGCTLVNAYGLVEGTSVVTMTRLEDPEEVRFNTVGRPIPGVEIKIVDQERNPVDKGEVGELAIKGYNMEGYYKNPEKTREVIDGKGWLYTGDLARYYDEENISIVGRCKDMVIRGGFNVYPSDVEEYILRIPGVQNVAVVGREHPVLGEEIVAFVLAKAGQILTKNDVIRGLFHELANYKMPDEVIFVSEMPTILAGKVDKKILSQWARDGVPEDKKMLFYDLREE